MDEEDIHPSSGEGQENPDTQGVGRGAVKGSWRLENEGQERSVSNQESCDILVGDAIGSR